MTRWRARTSLREAWSNVVAAPFLFGVLTIVAAVLGGGAALSDLAVTQQILAAEREFVAAGGDILRATPDEGTIEAADCTAVGDLPGVVGVSAVTQVNAQIAGRPDHVQTILLATPGIERVLDVPPLSTGEVLAAAALGERWSWDAGTMLRLVEAAGLGEPWTPPSETLRIGAMPDLSRLGDSASTSLIVPQPAAGDAASCVVRVEPHLLETVAATAPAMLGEPAVKIQVDRQVYAGQFGPDPSADFLARPTQWSGLVAGGVLGLIVALVGWTRRQRSALYATLGVPWLGGFQLRFTEAMVPVVAGLAWGVVWAAAGGIVLGLPSDVVFVAAALHGAAALAVATVVVVLASLWRPPTLQALKDR